MKNGRDPPAGGVPLEGAIIGGADADGSRPRARRAAMRGFSACAVGSEGMVGIAAGIWGGGVGCWLTEVFLISSAKVAGFKSCCKG